LTLKGPDSRDLLADFQTTTVTSSLIAYGETPDVNEPALQLNPELSHILFTFFEGFKNSVNDVDAFGRMTILHLTADNSGTPGENTAGCIRIVDNCVIFIHKTDVHRQMPEHQVHLFWAELTGPQVEQDPNR